MKQLQKQIGSILFFIFGLCLAITPIKAADWNQSNSLGGVTSTKTATTQKAATLNWQYHAADGWNAESTPIIVGDYIYAADGNAMQLIKLTKDGKRVSSNKGQIDQAGLYWVVNICYGDGKVYVPLNDGRIQAFDADTLETVWISEPANNTITSKLTYADGSLYAGTMSNDKENISGEYIRISTSATKDVTDGVKSIDWRYHTTDVIESHYWNQSAVYGDYVIIADGLKGNLLVLNKSTGELVSMETLDSGVSGGITYDESTKQFYLVTKNTTVYTFTVNNGNIQLKSHKTVLSGGYSANTPTIYNHRVYIGGRNGAYGSKGFIAVLDADSLETIYKKETNADVQSQPLVTTGYATKENKQTAFVYFTTNEATGSLYVMEDAEGKTDSTINTLFVPGKDQQNYCMSDVIADNNGTLYYKNDSNTIFSIGKQITSVSKPSNSVYTGKSITKNVTVKSGNQVLTQNTDYKVTYTNNKKCGKATVTVTGIGNYTGTIKRSFYIKPKKASITKLTSTKRKQATVSVKKNSGSVTGYQVRYSYLKNFKKSRYKFTSKRKLTLKNLKSKKYFYVKVRAYKKVNSKKVYGKWSKIKKVRIK